MFVELKIVPGGNTHTGGQIAGLHNMIAASGLRYQLTPSGTCIEGECDEVISFIRECHSRVRETGLHLTTTIKLEDDQNKQERLKRSVASVEEKSGQALRAVAS